MTTTEAAREIDVTVFQEHRQPDITRFLESVIDGKVDERARYLAKCHASQIMAVCGGVEGALTREEPGKNAVKLMNLALRCA